MEYGGLNYPVNFLQIWAVHGELHVASHTRGWGFRCMAWHVLSVSCRCPPTVHPFDELGSLNCL